MRGGWAPPRLLVHAASQARTLRRRSCGLAPPKHLWGCLQHGQRVGWPAGRGISTHEHIQETEPHLQIGVHQGRRFGPGALWTCAGCRRGRGGMRRPRASPDPLSLRGRSAPPPAARPQGCCTSRRGPLTTHKDCRHSIIVPSGRERRDRAGAPRRELRPERGGRSPPPLSSRCAAPPPPPLPRRTRGWRRYGSAATLAPEARAFFKKNASVCLAPHSLHLAAPASVQPDAGSIEESGARPHALCSPFSRLQRCGTGLRLAGRLGGAPSTPPRRWTAINGRRAASPARARMSALRPERPICLP